MRSSASQEPSTWPPTLGEEAGLSPREVVLLGGVGKGYSNVEIAEQMSSRPTTTRGHPVRLADRGTTRSPARRWCAQQGFEPSNDVSPALDAEVG